MGDLMPNPVQDNGHAREGYIVEVGGKFDSEYGSITAALKAGLQLKNKSAQAQVKVYDTNERA
jgi:hypothetical protein